MVTVHDFAEDWLKARAILIEHLTKWESKGIHPLDSLSESQREVIAAHIQGAIDEYNALLSEYAVIQKDLMRNGARHT